MLGITTRLPGNTWTHSPKSSKIGIISSQFKGLTPDKILLTALRFSRERRKKQVYSDIKIFLSIIWSHTCRLSKIGQSFSLSEQSACSE